MLDSLTHPEPNTRACTCLWHRVSRSLRQLPSLPAPCTSRGQQCWRKRPTWPNSTRILPRSSLHRFECECTCVRVLCTCMYALICQPVSFCFVLSCASRPLPLPSPPSSLFVVLLIPRTAQCAEPLHELATEYKTGKKKAHTDLAQAKVGLHPP